jgi:hypothetical protein
MPALDVKENQIFCPGSKWLANAPPYDSLVQHLNAYVLVLELYSSVGTRLLIKDA